MFLLSNQVELQILEAASMPNWLCKFLSEKPYKNVQNAFTQEADHWSWNYWVKFLYTEVGTWWDGKYLLANHLSQNYAKVVVLCIGYNFLQVGETKMSSSIILGSNSLVF